MPIRVGSDLTRLSEESFKEVVYGVTGVAFSLHNQYGSLFAENHYKHEMAAGCKKLGYVPVETEVPIEVTYREFSKEYYADLIVQGGALFELKVVSAITNDHRAQCALK